MGQELIRQQKTQNHFTKNNSLLSMYLTEKRGLLFWINNLGTNSEIGYIQEIDKI